MWVSTGITGMPRLKSNTHEAVFGPTPLIDISHARAFSIVIETEKGEVECSSSFKDGFERMLNSWRFLIGQSAGANRLRDQF